LLPPVIHAKFIAAAYLADALGKTAFFFFFWYSAVVAGQ